VPDEPLNQRPPPGADSPPAKATSNPIAASYDQAWASFQARDTLHLAGDTLEWEFTRGRAQFLAFLIRIEDRAAREYLSAIAERLASIPGVETYPDWYWHTTVKVAGFQVIARTNDDDVLREDVPRIAGKARALLANGTAFEARLGPPNAFAEVVIAEVHDGGRVRELNTRLLESLPELARYPFDGARFLPHVSIARFRSNDGLAELKSALAELRQQPPGPSFLAGRVEFVRAWLSEEIPEFDTIAAYPLRSAR
jgi:2'-5' RNA ligase